MLTPVMKLGGAGNGERDVYSGGDEMRDGAAGYGVGDGARRIFEERDGSGGQGGAGDRRIKYSRSLCSTSFVSAAARNACVEMAAASARIAAYGSVEVILVEM